MSIYQNILLPLTLALGLSAPFVASAQQPAPPPERQSDSGWRKFSGPPAADQAGPMQMNADQNGAPEREPPPMAAPPVTVPGRIVVPAGTWITIRVNDVISTSQNLPGDAFTATLAQPLIADGIVLARRGQTLAGRVVEVTKGGFIKGTSRLGLELTELSLVDGRQVPVHTQLISYSSGTSRGRDGTAIAATTGAGAAIGGAAAGGFGAGMGAIAGAAASTIGVLATRGRNTEVYPEAMLTFRLVEPVGISTEHSAAAFRGVTQQDYAPRVGAAPAGPDGSPGAAVFGLGLRLRIPLLLLAVLVWTELRILGWGAGVLRRLLWRRLSGWRPLFRRRSRRGPGRPGAVALHARPAAEADCLA